MNIQTFISQLDKFNINFFTGVPDSQLKPLFNYLLKVHGICNQHIIAANEGNAVALAAGHYLATGQTPCVYLQNSGLGNIVNPVTSLLNNNVYGIPCVFVIGWRGEPNVHDEPQHIFQGEITLKQLDILDIAYVILDKDSTYEELKERTKAFQALLKQGKSVAFVIKKGALTYDEKINYKNNHTLIREQIIKEITKISNEDIIIATTGKTSRELFEIRKNNNQPHKYDFLTVGSMGHSSSIALGVALNKPNKRVWCIDGDGALLMHMGAMALIGAQELTNFIHVLINNEAHESVGGQPTVAGKINFGQIAQACGYRYTHHASNKDELSEILTKINGEKGPIFIEIKAQIGSRDDLGRPTTTPTQNKQAFMQYLGECE
jgi:phosphonopyruvate decarboxylase